MARLLRIDDKDSSILDALSAGPKNASGLLRPTRLTLNAISKKLGKLARIGMVERDGEAWRITKQGERLREAIRAETDLPAWERVWYKFAGRHGFEVQKY